MDSNRSRPDVHPIHPFGAGAQLISLSISDSEFLARLSASELLPNPDLLVIGAELAGLAAASMAADQGLKVQVVSECSLSETNSSSKSGLIWPSSLAGSGTDTEREFAFSCRDLWSRIAVRPGMEFDWKVSGIIVLGGSGGIPGWSDHLDELQSDGWAIQSVDGEQLKVLNPSWNPTSEQALFFPADGIVNPLSAAISFSRNLVAKKSSLRSGVSAILRGTSDKRSMTVLLNNDLVIHPKYILLNDGNVPSRHLPHLSLPRETVEFTQIRGFVPLEQPFCEIPFIYDKTSFVPRSSGCEIFHDLAGTPEPDPGLLQRIWQDLASRYFPSPEGETSGRRVLGGARRSHIVSSTGLPLLEQIPDVANLWWTLPDANDTLRSVGVARKFIEWLKSGTRPSSWPI